MSTCFVKGENANKCKMRSEKCKSHAKTGEYYREGREEHEGKFLQGSGGAGEMRDDVVRR
jgi:hypothetical protein